MYPIALDKLSNKLVNIEDVLNGKACNCYCFECKQDMIAINNGTKIIAHFRHDNNSNCSLSYESYIHWLAKKIFKEMDELRLPPLDLKMLFPFISEKAKQMYDYYDVPTKLRDEITLEVCNTINSKFDKIKLEIVEIEKDYSSNLGNIRADIVLKFLNKNGEEKKLFIEPYLSNPIDNLKLKKLKEINISTVSINLNRFINIKGYSFTKTVFENFLIKNITSKEWVYYNKNSILTKNIYSEIENKIKINFENITYYQSLLDIKKNISNEINIYEKDIEILNSYISDKHEEINNLDIKIKNIEYKL